MPSSLPHHISRMVNHILEINPSSILDIGVGFGKWGFLCREHLDVHAERYKPEQWKVRIDGCEAFPDYATPVYDYIYDNVYYGDVMQVIDSLPEYDMIIIGDVIEHFDKEVGQTLLHKLMNKSKFVLLSSPTKFFNQHVFDNPFEEHKSLWGIDDFKELDFDYDEFEHILFVVLIDCKRSGVVTGRHRKASQLAYRNRRLKARPKLAHLVKAVAKKLV